MRKQICLRIFQLALFFLGCQAGAAEITPEQAVTAVQNWLSRGSAKAMTAGFRSAATKGVRTFREGGPSAAYHVVGLGEGGYVITSGDTELPPIMAFTDEGDFDESEGNPLRAILARDTRNRMGSFASAGGGSGLKSASGHSANRAEWDRLLSAGGGAKNSFSSLSDVRVAPLVESKWDQSTMGGYDTFNYYTPNNSVCGCVATAFSQIMRYWCKPTGTVSAGTYSCGVEKSVKNLTMKGGTYSWGSMPLDGSTSPTLAQRQAIGKLTYDVGVASQMNYTLGSSGTWGAITIVALKERFGYASARSCWCYHERKGLNEMAKNAILGSLDAGMPVAVGIGGAAGGHEVVLDGYGYAFGTPYIHMNCGWSGSDNLWYNIMGETVTHLEFSYLDEIGYNIHPSERGEVISGRVQDESGKGVAGAQVVLVTPSGKRLSAESGATGIYSFRVTESGSYGLSASGGGKESNAVTVNMRVTTGNFTVTKTGLTFNLSDSDGEVGNRWGVDLVLKASVSKKPDLCFEAAEGWPADVYLTTTDSGREACSEFDEGEDVYLHAAFANRGTAAVGNGYVILHQVFDASGEEVASYSYEAEGDDLLAPGESRCWDGWRWAGLNGLLPGTYTYKCTLDAESDVPEADKSNNMAVYRFVVSGSPVPVTVTFDPNGGSVSPTSRQCESGTAYGELPVPVFEGFVFTGWFTSRTGGSQVTADSTVPSGDVTLYAHWVGSSAVDETVDLLATGGSASSSVMVNPGETWKLDFSARPEWTTVLNMKYGNFLGKILQLSTGVFSLAWSGNACFQVTVDANNTASERSWTLVITRDSTIVRRITFRQPTRLETVSVSFNANGGICGTATREYTVGSTYGWLPACSRSGYAFAGWFTDSTAGAKVTEESTVSASVAALYARWHVAIELGEAVDSEGLSFATGGDANWFGESGAASDGTDAAQSGAVGNNQSTWMQTQVIGPGNLSFLWKVSSEANCDVLAFSVDGVDVSRISGNVDWRRYGTGISSGAHVVRWTYGKDGSNSAGDDCGWVDQVVWQPTIDVVFNANGGSVSPARQTYEIGGTYGSLPVPVRSGYRFDGWYTAPAGGLLIDAFSTVNAAYAILYAHWSTIGEDIEVSFRANGSGARVDQLTRTYTVGGVYESFPVAVREGYSFLGWYTDATGGTKVYEDSTVDADLNVLYAHWSVLPAPLPDEYGPWGTLDDVDVSDGGLPTTIRQMKVVLHGEGAQIGDCVAVFRQDTGALCGLGKVRDEAGTVTIVMYVTKGVGLHFKVWDGVEVLEGDRSCDLVSPAPGSSMSGLTLTVSDQYELTLSLPAVKWHQVSFNVRPDDPSPAAVFADVIDQIDFVTTGDLRYWDPVSRDGTIGAIEIGAGYWVRTKSPNVGWTLAGQPDQAATIALKKGWNLIGYNLLEEGPVAEVFSTALGTGFIDMVINGNAFYPDTLTTMSPGKGYYVYASQACTISYDQAKASVPNGTGEPEEPEQYGPFGTLEDAGMSSDGGQPMVLRNAAVEIAGSCASVGDCVAVYRRDTGALCGLGKVRTEAGTVTIVINVAAGTALDFKAWTAASGLEHPVVIRETSGVAVVSAPGAQMDDLSLEFNMIADMVTVSFDAAGGEVGCGVRDYEVGSAYGELPLPVRTGYAFGGWYAESGSRIDETSEVRAEVTTLVAHWTPNTYTVAFLPGEGLGTPMPNQGFVYDVARNLSSNSYVRLGYVFTGWSRTNGGEPEFADGELVANLTDRLNYTVMLYACWESVLGRFCSIEFNANAPDSAGQMAVQLADPTATVSLRPNGFFREGFMFAGWSLSPDGEVEFEDGAEVSGLAEAGGTVVLYAVWREVGPEPVERVSVTFHSNDGRGLVESRDYAPGQYYGSLPSMPSAEGLVFVGWYSAPNGGWLITERMFVRGNVHDLYAQWIPVEEDAYFRVLSQESNATGNPDELTDEAIEWSVDGRDWFPANGLPVDVKPGTRTVRFRSVDGRWLAPAKKNVKAVKGKVVDISPVATRANLVEVEAICEGEATGKASVSAPHVKNGKSVTLTAKPGKGCVLACWINSETEEVIGTAAKLTVKPTMDSRYSAVFRKKSDYASLAAPNQALDEDVLKSLDGIASGAKFRARVEVDAEQWPVSFKASGLPPGLKINASTGLISGTPSKPGTYTFKVAVKSAVGKTLKTTVAYTVVVRWADEVLPLNESYGAYTVGVRVEEDLDDLPANCKVSGLPKGLKFSSGRIVGVPSKSGTYYPVFSCTSGGSAHKASTVIRVNALPSWSRGSFVGGGEGSRIGISVTSAGKVSGTLDLGGISYSLKASSLTAGGADYFCCSNVVATKKGQPSRMVSFTIAREVLADENGTRIEQGYLGAEVLSSEQSLWIDAWQSMWGQSKFKSFANKRMKNTVLAAVGESFGLAEGEKISFKFKTSGSVAVTGRFVTGTKKSAPVYYKPSSSATLVTTTLPGADFQGWVFVYFAPSAKSRFNGYVRCFEIGVDENGRLCLLE